MNKTSYHLPQPLPDPQNINELLSPLFKTVKTKKINSFLQFKNHSNELSQSIFSPRNQSIIIGTRETNRMNRTFQIDSKSTMNPEKEKQEKSNKKQLQKKAPQTSYIRHRKLRSEHPSSKTKSKIKRHLVQSIDFKEIQNKLYKRREWMTRYEHFYDKLKHKKGYKKPFHLQINEAATTKNQELTSNVIKKNQTLCVRSTPKKKFWIREKSQRVNLQNHECIQGTSFKSISHI